MGIGANRRKGDRRKQDLGGPVEPEPEVIEVDRDDAIARLVDYQLDFMRDWDSSDFADLLIYGYKAKPYKDCTNKELQEELDDTFEGEETTYKIKEG